MPKIAGIIKDTELTGNDAVVGSEAETNRTINIPLSALSSFVLTQTGIEEAITDNQGFRDSIGVVDLDYITESVEPIADFTVTTNSAASNTDVIRISEPHPNISVGSRFIFFGTEHIIRRVETEGRNTTRLSIFPLLTRSIPRDTVLTITAPISTTIESHLVLPDLPNGTDDSIIGQVYNSGGILQVSGNQNDTAILSLRSENNNGFPIFNMQSDDELDFLRPLLLSAITGIGRAINPDATSTPGATGFPYSSIRTIAENTALEPEQGSVEITLANAGVGAYTSATGINTPGISHKFTATGIETNGITFEPGTSRAGVTIQSNTLDDYEDGNWTPRAGREGGVQNNGARYIKIGSLVHIQANLRISSTGDSLNNVVNILGLPFEPDLQTTIEISTLLNGDIATLQGKVIRGEASGGIQFRFSEAFAAEDVSINGTYDTNA